MKRDPKLVIGGYSVPGGAGRIAVAAAVDLIKRYPGVKQVDVQKHAVRFSGLNGSTAGWVTSPGVKSPATILWDRRKEDVFRCFPNENTALFDLDPVQVASDLCKREMAESIRVKIGDLVQVKTYQSTKSGILVGFRLHGNWEFQKLYKGTQVAGIFTDPSFLDNPAIWGYGIPIVNCVVSMSTGLSDCHAGLVHAIDATA